MKSNLATICRATVYLAAAALHGITPKSEYLSEIDTDEVYAFSAYHSIGSLVTSSLSKLGLSSDEAIEKRNTAKRKIMLFDAERGELLRVFEEQGIKYMPLKGVYLKEMYPSIGDREMSDNDIMIDGSLRKNVRDIMVSRGYTVESYNIDNDDVYKKPPVYNFEMHASLFADELDDNTREYFELAFDRAERIENTSYGYRMTDEDFYIYQKAHEYKHYRNGGIGLRALIDTYVILLKTEDTLNREYVNAELEKLGILDYERETRFLSEKLFSKKYAKSPPEKLSDILTDSEQGMLKYMATSGTYGIVEREIESRLERQTEKVGSEKLAKRKMIREKFFPPMSYYKTHRPFLYKNKVFIPFFVIWRLLKILFTRPIDAYKQLVLITKAKLKKK